MRRLKKKEFKLPNATTLSGRKSTIAKSFSDGIAPRLQPTREEHEQFIKFFPKVDGNHKCAYCGDRFEYYEHFRPLVIGTKPTGYGSDIYNLVPSCGNCNQNKGNSNWKEWMDDNRNAGRADKFAHRKRVDQLKNFEKWGEEKVIFIDYEKVVGSEKWQQYMKDYQTICETLNEMHKLQKEIKSVIVNEVKKASNQQAFGSTAD